VTGPGFATLLACHVLAGLVGFGALGASGAFALAVARARDLAALDAARRYFSPGRNLASRAVLLVPVFGGALLGLDPADARRAFPWIGLGLWLAAVAIASAVVWPAERELQAGLAARRAGPPGPLGAPARRVVLGAAGTTLCFLAALVVMVAQPA